MTPPERRAVPALPALDGFRAVRADARPRPGFNVVALNVTKLRSDNRDPREYLGRLAEWQGRVEKTGGTWRVINDLDGLEGLL